MAEVLLSCEMLEDEMQLALQRTGVQMPIVWLDAGLHEYPAKIRAWYDAETARLHGELRDSLGGSRENTARKALKTFRATFHKPVIYAAWNWNETVEDALHQAGFATFEEQAAALAEQRKKLA